MVFPILVSKSGDNKGKCRKNCTKDDSKNRESRVRAVQRNELKGQIGRFYVQITHENGAKYQKSGIVGGVCREGQGVGFALLVAAVKGRG